MDTEGYNLPVLKGMVNTIRQNNHPILQIEFNKGCTNTDECLSFLDSLEYELFDTFHVDYFFRKKK